MPDAELRRQRAAYRRGLVRATSLAAVVLGAVGSLGLLAAHNARLAGAEAKRAGKSEAKLRRNLYADDMNLAQRALDAEDLDGALILLDAYRPKPGEDDLRTFEWRYLWNECQDRSIKTLPLREMALCADFSRDGKILAVACRDRKVHLYDAATYQELPTFPPFVGAPRFLVFSPDGRTLAVHCVNHRVVVCDLPTRRAIYSFPSRCSDCASLAFSPDGRLLAATAPNGRVLLWDTRARRVVQSISVSGAVVVAFSPRGRVLATQGPVYALRLLDLSTGIERALPYGGGRFARSLAFSRDGRRLAAGLENGTLRLWDVASGRPLPAPAGHSVWVYSVAFSPDDRRLATASSDSTVRLWDLATNREVARLRGHRSEVITVRFSPDGSQLVSACADGTVKLWDAVSSTRSHDIPGGHFALSPDGRRLAVQREGEPGVVLCDPVTGRIEGRLFCGRGKSAPICFSPRGDQLYIATTVRGPMPAGVVVADEITIWSVADRRQVARIPIVGETNWNPLLSPDGRYLALGDRIIDLERRRTWRAQGDPAAFSPAGYPGSASRLLVTSDLNAGLLRLYEPGTCRLLSRLPAEKGIAGAAFSPNGSLLATGGDSDVQLWDTRSWKQVTRFKAEPGFFPGLLFSPDGRTLATVGAQCRLWNTSTWRPTLTLKHATRMLPQLHFTQDGTAIATWGGGRFHLWRAPFPAVPNAPP
jgi:WD40 repeat protein